MLAIQLGTVYFQINQTQHNNVENSLSGMVFEFLNGITKIKIAGAETRAFGKWAKKYSKLKIMPNIFTVISSALSNAVSFGDIIFLYYLAFTSKMNASDCIPKTPS